MLVFYCHTFHCPISIYYYDFTQALDTLTEDNWNPATDRLLVVKHSILATRRDREVTVTPALGVGTTSNYSQILLG